MFHNEKHLLKGINLRGIVYLWYLNSTGLGLLLEVFMKNAISGITKLHSILFYKAYQ